MLWLGCDNHYKALPMVHAHTNSQLYIYKYLYACMHACSTSVPCLNFNFFALIAFSISVFFFLSVNDFRLVQLLFSLVSPNCVWLRFCMGKRYLQVACATALQMPVMGDHILSSLFYIVTLSLCQLLGIIDVCQLLVSRLFLTLVPSKTLLHGMINSELVNWDDKLFWLQKVSC